MGAGITIADIQRVASRFYAVPEAWMRAKDRHKDACGPRQVAMYLSRRLAGRGRPISFGNIGRHFGGYDHSTVIHAYRAVQQRIFDKAETEAQIGLLIDILVDPKPRLVVTL